jgi:hypothetical protein
MTNEKLRAIRMTIKEPINLKELTIADIKAQIAESELPKSTEDQDVLITFKVKI